MKKIVVCLLCIINVQLLHGMEREVWKTVRTAHFATHPKIFLIHDDIYKRYTKSTDIIVIGEGEQKKMLDKKNYDGSCVGNLTCSQNNIITIESQCNAVHGKNKTGRSLSGLLKKKKSKDSCCSITTKKIDSFVVYVSEPQLLFAGIDSKNKGNYQYRVTRPVDEKTEKNKEYFGDEARQEACKDLSICYINALERAPQLYCYDHKAKSIAFAPLGISLGFCLEDVAEIAVTSFIEFIKKCSKEDEYPSIEFVVSTKGLFDYCMKLFMEKKIECSGVTMEDFYDRGEK